MPEITLPNKWKPRAYQLPLWNYLENGGKRAIAVWHRRAGKDDLGLHFIACQGMQKPATYWYMLPQQEQARKAIWKAVNPHTGIRRIYEAFPKEIIESENGTEMSITLKSGGVIQIVGSDNYNSLVGSPPYGIVASEWALADPNAWAFFRPILKENNGWVYFNYTPRGRNHGHRFFESHKNDPNWFVQRLPATETTVFSAEDLESERQEYIKEYGEEDGENKFRQEYLCDFNASVVGAYYAKLIKRAEDDKRIRNVPYDPQLPVYAAWDLGRSDSTAIWFVQVVHQEIRLIDYYENSGQAIAHYISYVKGLGYAYEEMILPHDAEPKLLGTELSIKETIEKHGLRTRIVPNMSREDGINAARQILPRCYFDETKCERGLEALRNYRTEWDDKNKIFRSSPLHDWSSHGSDAFRYLALGLPSQPSGSWGSALNYGKSFVV